jgi:hypothetical protein
MVNGKAFIIWVILKTLHLLSPYLGGRVTAGDLVITCLDFDVLDPKTWPRVDTWIDWRGNIYT